MVLLNDACTWAMPSATFFLTFLRARACAVCCSSCRVGAFLLAIVAFSLCDLPDWHVQLDRRLARTLPRARIGAGALAAHRQALAMARAAVALQVDQPLDRHLDLAAQIALDREPLHALAQPVELGVVQVLDLAVALDRKSVV